MRFSTIENKRREYGPPPCCKGETNSGAAFGPIPGNMVKYLKAFNVQCAYYSMQSVFVTQLLEAQIEKVKGLKNTETFSVDRQDFINIIALANIGRQHLLFMEKESKEILEDARQR